MVTWEDFKKRRKIDLDMFRSYTYEDYSQWCTTRYVEPISKEDYEAVQSMLVPVQPPEEVTTVTTSIYDEKQLKKLRKPALAKLCQEANLVLEGNETKNKLVSLLLSLNNS